MGDRCTCEANERWLREGAELPTPSTNNQREGKKVLRWVRASERLPNDKRPVRRLSENDFTWIEVKHDYVYIDVDHCHLDSAGAFLRDWEWLEEIDVPAQPTETPSLPVEEVDVNWEEHDKDSLIWHILLKARSIESLEKELSSLRTQLAEYRTALEMSEVEITAMYKRVGVKGSNILDLINNTLKKFKTPDA